MESNSSGLSSYSEEEGDELQDKEMSEYMNKMDQELRTTDAVRTSVDNPTRKVNLKSFQVIFIIILISSILIGCRFSHRSRF